MDKKLYQFGIALVLFPILYINLLGIWYGDFPPTWFRLTFRFLIVGAIVLALLWAVPMRPLARAAVYVAGMMVGGTVHVFLYNRDGLSHRDFGWSGMMSLIANSQLKFFICGVITVAVIWCLSTLRSKATQILAR